MFCQYHLKYRKRPLEAVLHLLRGFPAAAIRVSRQLFRVTAYRDITFSPVVLINRVFVNRKAFWGVAESRLRSQPSHGLFRSFPGGVNTYELDVFFAIVDDMHVLQDEYSH